MRLVRGCQEVVILEEFGGFPLFLDVVVGYSGKALEVRMMHRGGETGRKGEVFDLSCARPQRLLTGDVGGHCHEVPSDDIKAL